MTRVRIERLLLSSASLTLQAAAVAVFTIVLMREVPKLGHRIPQPDLSADYLIALIWAAALGALLWLAPVREQDRTTLLLLWSARVIVALFFMLFYESHYGLDAYDY